MPGEPFGPPGIVYISGGAIQFAYDKKAQECPKPSIIQKQRLHKQNVLKSGIKYVSFAKGVCRRQSISPDC